MSNLFERSILMTLGAAMLTKEMAESLAGNLAQKGEDTTALGREAVDEAVEKAKTEVRSLRGRFDDTLQRNFRDLGLASSVEVEELKLKVAQLEHRIALLEAAPSATPPEGVIGDAATKEPEAAGKQPAAPKSEEQRQTKSEEG
jgi:polyhydroxyalkanoate synthesis regulator phasin